MMTNFAPASDNRCEVGAICQTSGYNHELKVMTMPSGRSFCEHDMEKIGGKERTKERFRVLHAIQQLGLSEDEKVLFKCMVLFTLGKLLPVCFCMGIPTMMKLEEVYWNHNVQLPSLVQKISCELLSLS